MRTEKCTIKNRYGITVVMCCASCKHKRLDNNMRLCTKGEGAVPPNYICPDWEISDTFNKPYKGDGRVKTQRYLQYALDRITEDDRQAVLASAAKKIYKRVSISQIRDDFEKEYGHIYIKGL